MVRQGSVAGFASDHHVLSGFLLVGNVVMAGLTGLVAGVNDRFGCYFRDCRTTEVSVLAKALGDDGCAQNHKSRQSDQHDCREPDQVLYVLEQACLPGNAIRITLLDTCTSCSFRSTMIEVTEGCDGGHERGCPSRLALLAQVRLCGSRGEGVAEPGATVERM